MKAHVGVDIGSGVVHTLETSTAKVHDSQKSDDLLHGDPPPVFGELPGLRHRFEQPLATAMSAESGRVHIPRPGQALGA